LLLVVEAVALCSMQVMSSQHAAVVLSVTPADEVPGSSRHSAPLAASLATSSAARSKLQRSQSLDYKQLQDIPRPQKPAMFKYRDKTAVTNYTSTKQVAIHGQIC